MARRFSRPRRCDLARPIPAQAPILALRPDLASSQKVALTPIGFGPNFKRKPRFSRGEPGPQVSGIILPKKPPNLLKCQPTTATATTTKRKVIAITKHEHGPIRALSLAVGRLDLFVGQLFFLIASRRYAVD